MRTEYGEIRSQTANKTKTSDQLNIFIEYIEKLRESRNYTAWIYWRLIQNYLNKQEEC